MISIVCSTITPDNNFKDQIIKSSGLHPDKVEFIFYENKGKYSLTEVYSKGLKKAKNEIVVFMHDDISIKSKNWGKKIIKHFESSDYGILGVAGTTSLGQSGRWWDNQQMMVGVVEHKHNDKYFISKYSNSFGDDIIETILTDGVFFAVSKSRLKYKFDTEIKNFHFYDVDFTFGNHMNGCKVGVIFNVRVLHKSIGLTNEAWEENRVNFVSKWSESLPHEIEGVIKFDKEKVKLKVTPKVAVIILNKSNNEILLNCINSFKQQSEYPNYKIYVGDTGSTQGELDVLNNEIGKYDNVSLHNIGVYNFGANNNKIVNEIIDADTELILFCNNDIELLNDSLSLLVKEYLKNIRNVGTLGCRLYYKNNKIQHGGIYLIFTNKDKNLHVGHMGLNSNYNYIDTTKDVVGSTAAFLMISKKLFNSVGQFNENYIECFEDVELNLSALVKDKKNYFVGDAVCYHYESLTRNLDANKNNKLLEDYRERLVPYINTNMNKLQQYIKVI